MGEHKCQGRVRGDWRSYGCSANAKHETDGKWYCGRHEPGKAAARKAKVTAKRSERYAATQKRWDAQMTRDKRRDACEAAFKGRPLATEKITEGVFWEVVDALSNLIAIGGGEQLEAAELLLAKLEE